MSEYLDIIFAKKKKLILLLQKPKIKQKTLTKFKANQQQLTKLFNKILWRKREVGLGILDINL